VSGRSFAYNLRFPGQVFDGQAGLHQNYFRDFDPATGRYAESDPAGLDGGINTYGYTAGNPISRYDSFGLTWGSNWTYFWDWALGRGDTSREYGQNAVETQEMQQSVAAKKMRDAYTQAGCKTINQFAYGTFEAYWDTTANPSTLNWGSTAFEVGGFGGGSIVNNGDGTATFSFPNVSGTHSFWFHVVPDRKSPTGAMRSIKQRFTWTEKVPACGCQH